MQQTTANVPPIFTPDFYRNPYPTYHQHLRGPVLQPTGIRPNSWAVFRYDTCVSLIRDKTLSAARPPSALVAVPREEMHEFEVLVTRMRKWLLLLDPPAHTSLRKLMNRGFAPLTVESLRPRIEEIVEQLLDAAVRDGKLDVLKDVAYPLPVRVISDLLGLPESVHERCITLSNDIASWFGTLVRSAESARRAQAAFVELSEYFEEAIARRGSARGNDLLGLLLTIKDDAGSAMGIDDLHAQCIMLLFAGHETTRNLIGNGLHTLLNHPEALREIRAEPHLMRAAIEEILRYETPVQAIGRIATAPIELDGFEIPAGAALTFVLAAAHRDPAQFPDPDRFDVKRTHNRHLAFGADAHVCIGSTLARLEASLCLSALIQRFPNMAASNPNPEWVHNMAFRGLRSLPVAV